MKNRKSDIPEVEFSIDVIDQKIGLSMLFQLSIRP